MVDELLKPAAVAKKLGMPPSTLRVYSTRFAELLSDTASNPPPFSDGKPGHRLYTARDVVVLGKAKELLSQGSTYGQTLEELRAAGLGVRPRPRSAAAPSNGHTSPSASPSVEVLQRAVEAWQALAEERSREIVALRQRVEMLESVQAEELNELRDRVARLEDWFKPDSEAGSKLARLLRR